MLTICTPTYNRSHTLKRTYESLINQTNCNFEWIVIDDGSLDETSDIIKGFQNEKKIEIKYQFQENSGKHVALNKGQVLASRELFMCLDSDDWLTDGAVENIINYYNDIKNEKKIGGMIFLDQFEDGTILGSQLPHEEKLNWLTLVFEHKMHGDKCYIFKTNVVKDYPFKNFQGNNHMPPSYQYFLISTEYDLLSVNIPLKGVEYMDDGISQNIVKKYFSAPDNYTYYRKVIHDVIPKYPSKIKNSIHYNITRIISQNNSELSPEIKSNKAIHKVTYPIGHLLYLYLKVKKRW